MIETLGPLGMRSFVMESKCVVHTGHYHNHDHVTFVDAGAIQVYWKLKEEDEEQVSRIFKAGNHKTNKVLIKAKVIHRIKAVEPGTIYSCVFTHRDFANGGPVQEYNGNPAAYE
jgi:hypothetical protein